MMGKTDYYINKS